MLGSENADVLLVDDQVHAFLAVGTLRAVDPDGGGVVDGDGVCGGIGGASCDGDEAGEETSDVAVHGDGLAWLVEGGLGDRVVATGELELHHVSHGSLDIVGAVGDGTARGANGDDMDGGGLRCEV